MTIRKALIFALFLLPSPLLANMVISNAPHAAAGGGSPTGSTFVSSGTAVRYDATDNGTFYFPSLPTTGNGVVLGLYTTGTSLPTSVKNNDNVNLVRSTSIFDGTASMGTAIYYDQSITVGSTYYVTVNWGGSPGQYGGNVIQITQQNNPAIDVSTGGVRNNITVSSTSPVTGATTFVGVAAYVPNSVNASNTFTLLPAGKWVDMGSFSDASAIQIGLIAVSTSNVAGVANNSRFSCGNGNRSTQSVSYFK